MASRLFCAISAKIARDEETFNDIFHPRKVLAKFKLTLAENHILFLHMFDPWKIRNYHSGLKTTKKLHFAILHFDTFYPHFKPF